MGSHSSFEVQIMKKKKLEIKLAIWYLIIKAQEIGIKTNVGQLLGIGWESSWFSCQFSPWISLVITRSHAWVENQAPKFSLSWRLSIMKALQVLVVKKMISN